MSYIGNTTQNQSYAPAVDFFNGDGSTTAFTLSRPVYSTPMVQVVISNVPQNPGSAFTVLNSTITFTSAPPSGTANIYVYYTSPNTTVAVLPQSPVISGDLTTTGGHYAIGAFNSGYTDGIVMDYTTGTGRITVGGSDGVSIYNGGPSSRSFLFGCDSSGNVGIGTSSPTVKCDVNGDIRSTNDSGNQSRISFGQYGSPGTSYSFIQGDARSSGFLAMWTAATERMRIDSSGNLLVNTTSTVGTSAAGVTHIVSGSSVYPPLVLRNGNATAGNFWKVGPDGSGNTFVLMNQSGTGVYIASGNTSWTGTSDERVKDIIEPIADAANKVSTLRAVIGKYKTDAEGTRRSFLIAQDVQKVLPEAVSARDDELGTLGLAYTDVIPLLVAAIQELKAEIDELKAKVK